MRGLAAMLTTFLFAAAASAQEVTLDAETYRKGPTDALVLESFVYVASPVPTAADSTRKTAARREYHVSRVIDGDTIVIIVPDKTSFTEVSYDHVRLLGINAPEWSHWGRESQCFASESTKALASAVLGKTVRLIRHGRDRYGRSLAYVYRTPRPGEVLSSTFSTHDADRLKTVSVNRWLIENGYAEAYRKYPHAYRTTYETVEAKAKAKGVGMWGEICKEPVTLGQPRATD